MNIEDLKHKSGEDIGKFFAEMFKEVSIQTKGRVTTSMALTDDKDKSSMLVGSTNHLVVALHILFALKVALKDKVSNESMAALKLVEEEVLELRESRVEARVNSAMTKIKASKSVGELMDIIRTLRD